MVHDYIDGFLIELALIMTVGVQNAFILQQGIKREFVVFAVLACAIGETILVTIGIGGVGAIIANNKTLVYIVTGVGALFLAFYSLKSFYTAFRKSQVIEIDLENTKGVTAKQVLMTGFAFALLNPHVLIDSTLMGALSVKYMPHQWVFGAGVITAPFVWYSVVAIIGVSCSNILNTKRAWQAINIFVGCICMYMALQFAGLVINQNVDEHNHNTIFFQDLFEHEHEHEHHDHNH